MVMRGGLWGHRRGLAYLYNGDEGWAMGLLTGAWKLGMGAKGLPSMGKK